MILHRLNFKKSTLLIAHKLLFDVLFFALTFFVLAFLAESLIPGIIISHIGFSETLIVISIAILLIYFSGISAQIDAPRKNIFWKNKKTAFLLAILGGALFLNSFLKTNLFANFLITATSLVFIWFVLLVMDEE